MAQNGTEQVAGDLLGVSIIKLRGERGAAPRAPRCCRGARGHRLRLRCRLLGARTLRLGSAPSRPTRPRSSSHAPSSRRARDRASPQAPSSLRARGSASSTSAGPDDTWPLTVGAVEPMTPRFMSSGGISPPRPRPRMPRRQRRCVRRTARRLTRLRSRRSGSRELIGNRRNSSRRRDLEVIAALAEIDHIRVVRVAENAQEEALVERLAVAAQELARLAANGARRHRMILARRELGHRLLEQRERLIAREPLADHLRLRGARRWCTRCRLER